MARNNSMCTSWTQTIEWNDFKLIHFLTCLFVGIAKKHSFCATKSDFWVHMVKQLPESQFGIILITVESNWSESGEFDKQKITLPSLIPL